MKCDRCSNEATVHEVTIVGGEPHEKHLCEACAKAEQSGKAGPGNGGDASGEGGEGVPGIQKLLSHFVAVHTVGGAGAAMAAGGGVVGGAAMRCNGCGMTLGAFKHSGQLGCAACYEAFERVLGPLISRAHEGGTHHVGKKPRSCVGRLGDVRLQPAASASEPKEPMPPTKEETEQAERAKERLLNSLKRELAKSIEQERYEAAAALRDQIRALESGEGGGTTA